MQQLVILLVINFSSTCFGRLYAHHQEVRLRYTAYGFLSCCSCCGAVDSGGKPCALCGVGCCHLYPLILKFISEFCFKLRHSRSELISS